eukprot:GEMP01021803.1.p1 GENE.GEMP01021803.1~~GEMP01021803.1.p1  ORF type:complete len:566 (+),score=135.42 GEMP01021803.1:153-1850(+)
MNSHARIVREELERLKFQRVLQFEVFSIINDVEQFAVIGRKILLETWIQRGSSADVLPRVFQALHLYELYGARLDDFSTKAMEKAIESLLGEIESERLRHYPVSDIAQRLKHVQDKLLQLIAATRGTRPLTGGRATTGDLQFESLLRDGTLLDLWKRIQELFVKTGGLLCIRDALVATLKTLPAHRLKIFVRLFHCVVHPHAVPYYLALKAPNGMHQLAAVVANAIISADLHSMPYETSKQRKEIMQSSALTQKQQQKLDALLSHQYCTKDPDCERPSIYPAPLSPYERWRESSAVKSYSRSVRQPLWAPRSSAVDRPRSPDIASSRAIRDPARRESFSPRHRSASSSPRPLSASSRTALRPSSAPRATSPVASRSYNAWDDHDLAVRGTKYGHDDMLLGTAYRRISSNRDRACNAALGFDADRDRAIDERLRLCELRYLENETERRRRTLERLREEEEDRLRKEHGRYNYSDVEEMKRLQAMAQWSEDKDTRRRSSSSGNVDAKEMWWQRAKEEEKRLWCVEQDVGWQRRYEDEQERQSAALRYETPHGAVAQFRRLLAATESY